MAEHDWSRDWYCRTCGVSLEYSLASGACAHSSRGFSVAALASNVARVAARAVSLVPVGQPVRVAPAPD